MCHDEYAQYVCSACRKKELFVFVQSVPCKAQRIFQRHLQQAKRLDRVGKQSTETTQQFAAGFVRGYTDGEWDQFRRSQKWQNMETRCAQERSAPKFWYLRTRIGWKCKSCCGVSDVPGTGDTSGGKRGRSQRKGGSSCASRHVNLPVRIVASRMS